MPISRLAHYAAKCDLCDATTHVAIWQGRDFEDALAERGWCFRHYVKVGWVSFGKPAMIDVVRCPDHYLSEANEADEKLCGYKLTPKLVAV